MAKPRSRRDPGAVDTRGHGMRCRCDACKAYLDYQARWQARVTREYAFAVAHARNERAWASKRAMHRHAHAVACAVAREIQAMDGGDPKTRRAWAEIMFEQPEVSEGTWSWEAADGPPRGLSVNVS